MRPGLWYVTGGAAGEQESGVQGRGREKLEIDIRVGTQSHEPEGLRKPLRMDMGRGPRAESLDMTPVK